MRALAKTTFILGILVGTIGFSSAAVPTGAFIRRPVKNIEDLVAHAKSDPIVMDRFVRHFRLRPDQVVTYFRSLHMAKLAKDGVYLVYNVRPDNVIRGRHFNLKKGTVVFADAGGRPILKKECANPMWMGLPPIVSDSPVAPAVNPRSTEVLDIASTEDLVTMEPTVMPVSAPPMVAGPIVPPVARGISVASGGGLGFLPFFLIGGGAASFLIKKEDRDIPPIPEPATIIIAGSGFAAVVARRRKKN